MRYFRCPEDLWGHDFDTSKNVKITPGRCSWDLRMMTENDLAMFVDSKQSPDFRWLLWQLFWVACAFLCHFSDSAKTLFFQFSSASDQKSRFEGLQKVLRKIRKISKFLRNTFFKSYKRLECVNMPKSVSAIPVWPTNIQNFDISPLKIYSPDVWVGRWRDK